jgi:hypothetical protein
MALEARTIAGRASTCGLQKVTAHALALENPARMIGEKMNLQLTLPPERGSR